MNYVGVYWTSTLLGLDQNGKLCKYDFPLNLISSHSMKYQQQWHGRDKSDEVCEEEEQEVVSQA